MRIRRSIVPIAAVAAVAFVGLVGSLLYASAARPTLEREQPSIVFVCMNGVAMSVWSALTFDRLAEQFLPRIFDPSAFALKLAHKDITLATELGRELNVPLRIASLVHEELTEAMNRGWAERDSRIFMLLQEERAGVNIAVPANKVQEALARG